MNCRFRTSIVQGLIISICFFSFSPSFAFIQPLAVSSQNETLLISDIDDTLKNTHVLSKWDTVQNALRTDNPFYGMTSLFQLLAKNQPQVRFAYLSNAPESLMYSSHEALLKNAKFPAGDLILRKNTTDNGHKNRAIRALVEKYQPQNLILIGDNGEQDTLIYIQAAQEFKHLNVKVFIHQIYSIKSTEQGKRLEAGQIGYVTAVDLALNWFSHQEISASSLQAWAQEIIPTILKEKSDVVYGSVTFPKWLDCRDYVPEQFPTPNEPLILQYVDKRNQRCKIQ